MRHEIKGLLFRLPALILLLAGFIGSIYAKVKNIAPVDTFGPAVIFLIILVMYTMGEYHNMHSNRHPSFD